MQVAFTGGLPEELVKELAPMHVSEYGSVHLLIVKGDYEAIMAAVNRYNPVLVDLLPLTLEEIFIYELGGLGYEIKDVVL